VSEDPPKDAEGHAPPDEPEVGLPRHRLDPDAAAAAAGAHDAPRLPPPVIDTRRYRWMIGIFGLILVIAFSIYEWGKHGVVSPGVPAGKRLHFFVAPLATTGPDKPANPRPRCDPAHPNPMALNICGRTPVVLAFFATGSGACKRQVDTLQTVSRQFRGSGIEFAAVAISGGRAETRKLVRQHRWTIPVAFDSVGAIGALYGVSICPMLEVARRGGVVAQRLIGEHWLTPGALSARVRALLRQ
jgi:thiol-disulfide isomerase/thioredoxin